jgi:hypothetical protein
MRLFHTSVRKKSRLTPEKTTENLAVANGMKPLIKNRQAAALWT